MFDSKINELIPSNNDYVAVYESGKKHPIIGWASRKTDETQVVDGDVRRQSDVSGLVVKENKVIFADEINGFLKYEMASSESEKEMLV